MHDTIPAESIRVRDGLATYDLGHGETVLLMPYPHGFAPTSAAEGALARALLDLGRRVITFDPPGAFRSVRPAQVTMPEMLGCAQEALAAGGVESPITVIGHSMSGFCALAYTLEHPAAVPRPSATRA